MESMTRFWSHEAQNIRCVREADFDRVTAEREALQLLLNNRDDLDDQLTTLEQRRYAEQQAREAAERRAEELEELLSLARQYVRDLASSLENACEFFEGNEEDDPQASEECEEARRFEMRIEAALNPAAEAESHE